MNIAVLITCHNRREKTLSCLHSLYNCALPDTHKLHIYLVDDQSTDGTSDAVKNEFPLVNIIQGNGKLFWNRGMHLAWETAAKANDFEFYLWLNDDTFLFQEALEKVLNAANSTENRAIIVASSSSKRTGELTYGGLTRSGKKINPCDKLQETATFNGNCVLIPKFAYQKVGKLDPLFHHTLGDIDYGFRTKSNGIKSYVAPGFLAYCERHETLAKWCLKEITFLERVKSLYSPLGLPPYYHFRYDLRHFGIVIAFKHFFSIHLRLLVPQLWEKKLSSHFKSIRLQ